MIDCISQMENSKNKFGELMDILKSSVKDIIIIVWKIKKKIIIILIHIIINEKNKTRINHIGRLW